MENVEHFKHDITEKNDYEKSPKDSSLAEFNRVIDHAIQQGMEASLFLQCWREGDWEGCSEFGFEPHMGAYFDEVSPTPRPHKVR